jgi:hypothetical protein
LLLAAIDNKLKSIFPSYRTFFFVTDEEGKLLPGTNTLAYFGRDQYQNKSIFTPDANVKKLYS